MVSLSLGGPTYGQAMVVAEVGQEVEGGTQRL